MAFVEIDDETFNSFDDEVKSHFKKFEPEDTTALKENANKILSEKKALEADILELKANIKKSNAKSGNGGDELRSQLEDALKQLNDHKAQLEESAKQAKRNKIQMEAQKIGTELAPSDARRASLLAEKAAARLDLGEDGNHIVLGDDGKATVSTLAELKTTLKTSFDFLVDGPNSSGGGAFGGSGGATKTDTSKMTAKQKLDFSRTQK